MPTLVLLPLPTTAGVLALVLLWPRVRFGPSAPRLVIEMAVTTFALSAPLWGLRSACPGSHAECCSALML